MPRSSEVNLTPFRSPGFPAALHDSVRAGVDRRLRVLRAGLGG